MSDGAPAPQRIRLIVNGQAHELAVAPHALLLDVLRDRLDLKGAKRSCDSQVCGACTVLVDGLAVSACTYLAVEADGRAVLTVEGLAEGDRLRQLPPDRAAAVRRPVRLLRRHRPPDRRALPRLPRRARRAAQPQARRRPVPLP